MPIQHVVSPHNQPKIEAMECDYDNPTDYDPDLEQPSNDDTGGGNGRADDADDLMIIDLLPREKRVQITDPKTRAVGDYLLVEASGEAAIEYQNMIAAATRYNKAKEEVEIKGVANCQPRLISRCLYRVIQDQPREKWPKVDEMVIRRWNNRAQKMLFTWIRDNSDLADDQTVEEMQKAKERLQQQIDERRGRERREGNSSNGTPGGSS